MKNLILIILLFLSFALFNCNSKSKKMLLNIDVCERLSIRTQELINDYFFLDERKSYARLDSALIIIDSIEDRCGKYNANNYMRKLVILSLKKEYSNALIFAEKLSDTLVGSVYKSVVINRFKAMIAQKTGNFVAKQYHISEIINILKSQFTENEIDSVLSFRNADSIVKYDKYFYLRQYYYYLAQFIGIDKVNNELDSLYKDVDDKFLWVIKPEHDIDFMIFEGM
ncbi:MAG: hypothetical protein LBJ63_08945 [Prevotellaceae bacterium]|jgi:hypothetical protein|nr:hypothetical protein [Prevotellaceae bacterium]